MKVGYFLHREVIEECVELSNEQLQAVIYGYGAGAVSHRWLAFHWQLKELFGGHGSRVGAFDERFIAKPLARLFLLVVLFFSFNEHTALLYDIEKRRHVIKFVNKIASTEFDKA